MLRATNGTVLQTRGITIAHRSPDELAELGDIIAKLRRRIVLNVVPDHSVAVANLITLEREYARSAAQ